MIGCHFIHGKKNINTQEYWNERCISNNTNAGTSAVHTICQWIKHNIKNFDVNIADIGSGPNKPMSFLNVIYEENNGLECYSFDISDEICRTWNNTHVKSKKCILPNIPVKNDFFDIVLCSHTLEHVNDIYNSIKEISRVTVDKGIIIINSPIGCCWMYEPEHVWWMDHDIDYGFGKIIDSFEGDQYKSLVQIYQNEKELI